MTVNFRIKKVGYEYCLTGELLKVKYQSFVFTLDDT